MSKVDMKPGRQAQEVGAAIVQTWFKLLPTPATILKVDSLAGQPLKVKINRRMFSPGNDIFLRDEDGAPTTKRLKVGTVVDAGYNQQLSILDGASPVSTTANHIANLESGLAIPSAVTDPNSMKPELDAVLNEIVKAPAGVTVTALFDTATEVHVVVPRIPDYILTRGDLMEYLRQYHEHGQGRHYHDELGVAVLFGCR